MEVLIVGAQRDDVASLKALLGTPAGFKVSASSSGLPDLSVGKPDVMILVLSAEAASEIQTLNRCPPDERPPTILVGHSSEPQLLRQALRAGARDFFSLPVAAAELHAALARIAGERRSKAAKARFTAVINARGGAGGSTVAANLAHVLALQGDLRVALIDFDMQFGSLPLHFDMQPNDGLPQAIASAERLDTPALEACMLKHPSGLHVLGTAAEHLVLPGEVGEKPLKALLALLGRSYDQVVLDLPRQIDAPTAAAIQQADRIAVVLQQTLPHLREAKRLTGLLQREFEIPAERIVIVVNRWGKQGPVTWADLKQALPDYVLVPVRNDYARVSQSANLGIPLLAAAPGAGVAADLQNLTEVLAGVEVSRRRGLLSRLFL